jgi:hypothetical protein
MIDITNSSINTDFISIKTKTKNTQTLKIETKDFGINEVPEIKHKNINTEINTSNK